MSTWLGQFGPSPAAHLPAHAQEDRGAKLYRELGPHQPEPRGSHDGPTERGNHRTVENPVHYVRDETLGEDHGQAAKGDTAQALAALRNGLLTALRVRGWASIAQALRYCASSIQRSLRIIGAAPPAQPHLQLSPAFPGI